MPSAFVRPQGFPEARQSGDERGIFAMTDVNEVRRAALVGGGLIGGGWAARCLAHGLVASDPGFDGGRRSIKGF
jgi:hypothetical protein